MTKPVGVSVQKTEGKWKLSIFIGDQMAETFFNGTHHLRRAISNLTTDSIPRIEWHQIEEGKSIEFPIEYPDRVYIKEQYGIK